MPESASMGWWRLRHVAPGRCRRRSRLGGKQPVLRVPWRLQLCVGDAYVRVGKLERCPRRRGVSGDECLPAVIPESHATANTIAGDGLSADVREQRYLRGQVLTLRGASSRRTAQPLVGVGDDQRHAAVHRWTQAFRMIFTNRVLGTTYVLYSSVPPSRR